VAEFEREMIRERTLTGIRAARTNGKRIGRPKRVFRRDEVVRLRDQEGLSWRAIAAALGVPVTTVHNAYHSYAGTVAPQPDTRPGGQARR
jgi:putative DNA-invertase from lambdoid prophage Rac